MRASNHHDSGGKIGSGLTIAEVMRTDFRSCNASTPIGEAATALLQGGCPVLAVTQAQVPSGILTERALASTVAEGRSNQTAANVMAPDPATIATTAPLAEAAARFEESGGPLLAVDGDGLLKGVVTLAELGPKLPEADLRRLITRLASGRGLAGAIPHAAAPAAETRASDPTAEIKSSKSQAQSHPWDSPSWAHPEPVPLVSPADLVNPLLKVCDVMTKSPRTCSAASTALEAALLFRDAGCHELPVTDEKRPIGVVTERDVALALATHEAELARTPVSDFMTRDVPTIPNDASLDSAIESLGEHHTPRLMAVDSEGRLVGVLTWRNLVPHLSDRGLGRAVSRIVEHS